LPRKYATASRSPAGYGGFNQIIQSALRHVRQYSKRPWSHGKAEVDPAALHLFSLLNSLVATIRIGHGCLAVQEISGWGEIMHMGSRGFHGVDEAALAIHADVDFHPVGEAFREAVVPLVAFLGLV